MTDLAVVPVAAELVALDEGEVDDLTADEAEIITSRIRRWANSFPVDDVVRAYRGRIWVALAYDSWAEWCECELGGLKLPIPQRREVVTELADAGMSNVAIGDAVGIAEGTVRNDLTSQNYEVGRTTLGQDGRERSYPRAKPSAPQPEKPEVVDAEIVDPVPPAQPTTRRRRPITDSFRDASWDIARKIESLGRLAADDRFSRSGDDLACRNLWDLKRARQQLDEVITQLEGRWDR